MNNQKVQLVLSFDPHPERREEYFQFFMCEFIPTLELLGLKMCEAWHTAYGEYPLRLSCFHARGSYAVEEIVESGDFLHLEDRLQSYVVNYKRKIIQRPRSFQI